jgi:hypothetical protein
MPREEREESNSGSSLRSRRIPPIDRSPINTQKKDDKEVVPKMQALSPVECFAAVAARKVKYSRKFL